ncbi:MAG: hypothetical protein F6J89_27160 [Symploca sp. SIO1C4]|uniref:RuBisCO accumulation factor 1 n=1 Tax=Symploca sp. SIO1C4 TaxID=2607765 RepID=A0A6B3NDL3_9CYAN|nr:hypothetical protein [Symploca sp. SIO1C4]
MSETAPDNKQYQPQVNSEGVSTEELITLLRRKQGNWAEWGVACQQLQKAGYNPQDIFEETGFEPIQQNQIIVASQVYSTIIQVGVSEEVRSRFERTGSDILYELRILTQAQRATAAEFIVARNIDSEGAREVAKAFKEFSRLSNPPKEFSNHPGDAVAYQYWKLARQRNDLQERSRLIARGLMFAHTQESRQQIEKLLSEAFGKKPLQAPRLPIYRLEAEENLPRLLPVVGQMPLKLDEFNNVTTLQASTHFELVEVDAQQTLVAIPGWQVVRKAQAPVAIVSKINQLPGKLNDKPEDVLLLIDRTQQVWDDQSYFLVEHSGDLAIEWFPETPNCQLLGRLFLVLRPKQILDEAASSDVWQIDE